MTNRDRTPLAELLALAFPSIAQMASYTVMQFIDAWMLARLGGLAATAASNAGMLAFSLVAFGMGIVVIVNTLVSQSFGRQDWLRCGEYLWQGVWLAAFFGIALLPLVPLARPIFHLFGHPAELVEMEAIYWRIVLLSAVLKLAASALGNFFLGINRPSAVLIAAAAGVGINAVCAYAIVLGHFGFSSWGVAGSAWAQNIGGLCEMATLWLLVLRGPIRKTFGVLRCSLVPRSMATLIRIGIPSGLQWFNDVFTWSIFCNGVVAVLGTVAMQANTFMLKYMVVTFMPVYGLSTAVTALVGRYIGRGQPAVSTQRTNLAFIVALVYVTVCGAAFVIGRSALIRLFSDDPSVIAVGEIYMVYCAVYEIFDAMYIIYGGGLRGAGDTLAPMIAMASLGWTINIGGGYLAALYLPSFGYGRPWIIACIYGGLLGIYVMVRFLRGNWRGIQLEASDLDIRQPVKSNAQG